MQRCKILPDELVYSIVTFHFFDTIREDITLLRVVSRDWSNFWPLFIVGKVYTNGRNESQWLGRNRTLRKRVFELADITWWIRLRHFLWHFLLLRHVLHLVPVCLSRRCWIGFVNHAVRIARIIPRSCGIIKEVLPGTISPSSMETCVPRSGVADDLSGLHWSAHSLPVVNYLHLICLYLFLESTRECRCRDIRYTISINCDFICKQIWYI